MSENLNELIGKLEAADGHSIVDSVGELLETIDTRGPAGVSLSRHRGGDEYAIVAVGKDGSTVWFFGEGDYDEDVKTLITRTESLSLSVADIGNWPPCEDPRWCQPAIAARIHHQIGPLAAKLQPRKKTNA